MDTIIQSRRLNRILSVTVVVLSVIAGNQFALADEQRGANPNETVLAIVKIIPDGGGYYWPKKKVNDRGEVILDEKPKSTGAPWEIRFKGKKILSQGVGPKGDPGGGTYCNGLTFAVAMKSIDECSIAKDKSVEQVKQFQREWYGNSKDKDIQERQCQVAVETLGVGQAVEPKDAKPGDFVQFWRRKGGGHSAVFLNWIEEERDGNMRVVGFRYRSSQGSTDGIGNVEERFHEYGGPVKSNRVYFARLRHAEEP